MPNSEELEARVAVYSEIAQQLLDREILPDAELILRLGRVRLAVKGYFILNRAYKRWKINEDHLTQQEKIAALMSLAISTFKPFRPVDPTNVKSIGAAKANEIFALACVSSITGAKLKFNYSTSSNMMFRIIDIISSSSSKTLEPFVVDVGLGIDKRVSDYDSLSISEDDKTPLNGLITIFELLPKRD